MSNEGFRIETEQQSWIVESDNGQWMMTDV